MHLGLDIIAEVPHRMVQPGGEFGRHSGVARGNDEARDLLGRRERVSAYAAATQLRPGARSRERRQRRFEMLIDRELVELRQLRPAQPLGDRRDERVGDRQRR